MNEYEKLLEKEEGTLRVLKSQISLCEKRIAALRIAIEASRPEAVVSQPLPRTVPHEIEAELKVSPRLSRFDDRPQLISEERSKSPRLRKDSVAIHVLPFLASEKKTLSEISDYLAAKLGRAPQPGSLRTMMMNLRVVHKLVDSEKPGIFELNEAGLKWLSENASLLSGTENSEGH